MTLSYWETGKTLPRLPELNSVLQALDVNLAERRTVLRLLEASPAVRYLHLQKESAVPQVRGDLLWSLRLRKGWTQTEAARAIGVNQAQIARWEGGEAWPDTERLQALCWSLGAQPEEVAALTTGTGYGLPEPLPYAPEKNNSAFDAEQWQTNLYFLLNTRKPSDALLDLTLLSVEHHLSALSDTHPSAASLLPAAYAVHARHHLNSGRSRQAARWADCGLALARRERSKGSSHFAALHPSLWFGNVLVASTQAAQTSSPAGFRRAAGLLKQWLPTLSDKTDGHYAWGLSELALSLGRLERTREAVAVSREACVPENSAFVIDYLYRLRDHAALFLEIGHYREALEVLEKGRVIEEEPGDCRARHRLLEAQCLIGLGDTSGANERLRAVEKDVQERNLTHLQEPLHQTAMRL